MLEIPEGANPKEKQTSKTGNVFTTVPRWSAEILEKDYEGKYT